MSSEIISFREAKEDKELDDNLKTLLDDYQFGTIWEFVNLCQYPNLRLGDPSHRLEINLRLERRATLRGTFEPRPERCVMPLYQSGGLCIEGIPDPQPGICYLVTPEVALGLLTISYPVGSFGIPIKKNYRGTYEGVCIPSRIADVLAIMAK